jgi:3-phenylpropionate/trans-cinnamate dioxygenase ferredoxin reductase component
MSTEPAPFIVVGAGQAGVQAAEALRALDADTPILLLGAEPHGPYHRPPLSKAWLAGEMDAAQLAMRTPDMLAKKRIELRTGVRVAAIDRTARALRLHDGSTLPYRGLVLATGSVPRRLSLPGANAPNVHVLRSRDDASALAASMAQAAAASLPLVVIGGGFIGLEAAATARRKGLDVTVLEAQPRLLARALVPALSDWFAALHRERGVQIVFDARVAALDAAADGRVVAVRLADGTRLPAGVVLVGVGVDADDALARAAGLECDRGVVVDDCARTTDPLITAAGDCTARRTADGSLLRLESVNNATEQGKSAAAALLGQPRPFTGAPWFWSDQYDRKLQMAGLSAGANASVLRGSMDSGGFTLFHCRDGRLVAADSVNAAKDHLAVRKLLDAGVSPAPEQLADPAVDLAALAAGQAGNSSVSISR